MKSIFLLPFALCGLTVETHGQLPPSLKTHADRFETDRAALTTSAENFLKPARDRYLTALTEADKLAKAAANQGDAAAIAAERRDVEAGSPAEAFPPDLPRSLQLSRRDYTTAVARVAKTVPEKLRELSDTYLRAIADFESSALSSKDPVILTAVAGEKQRITLLLEAAGGLQKHRNVVANSHFSSGVAGQMPPDWKAEAEIPVTDASTFTEGGATFLRFRRLQPLRRANLLPVKEVTIPAKARSVEFGVKLRVEGLIPGKDYDIYPGAHVTGRDAQGEEAGGGWAVVKKDGNWDRFTIRFPLEPSAKTLRIAIGPFGAAGVFDVDDIEVEFK